MGERFAPSESLGRQAYEPQSVNDVMVHHAKDLVDQNNMQARQTWKMGVIFPNRDLCRCLLVYDVDVYPSN